MSEIISKLRMELKENADEQVRNSSQHFFKGEIICYGIKSSQISTISKEYFKTIKGKNKREIFDLCGELWQSGMLEESFIACNWSYLVHKNYEPDDLWVFEKWIGSYVNNWASCDTICNHTVGAFMEMYPEYLSELKRWTKSNNGWMRRASAVSLIVPARKGMFLNDIFEIADLLISDTDDLVRKGYGWMLKVASHSHQKEVFDYIMSRKSIMPRTALRYAIEKMPAILKIQAMARY